MTRTYAEMKESLRAGDYVSFVYDNNERTIKIEQIGDNFLQGYDIIKKGYRRFNEDKLRGQPCNFLLGYDQGEVLTRKEAEDRAGIKFEYDEDENENRVKVFALCTVIAAKDKTVVNTRISSDNEIVALVRKTDEEVAMELLREYLSKVFGI